MWTVLRIAHVHAIDVRRRTLDPTINARSMAHARCPVKRSMLEVLAHAIQVTVFLVYWTAHPRCAAIVYPTEEHPAAHDVDTASITDDYPAVWASIEILHEARPPGMETVLRITHIHAVDVGWRSGGRCVGDALPHKRN